MFVCAIHIQRGGSMNRINLPGKEKHKRILLIILVIIAIVILVHEGGRNLNNKKIQDINQKNEKELIIEPSRNTENNIENVSNYNNQVKQEEKSYSTKENELYNEAYTLFFSKEYTNSINKADELVEKFPNNSMGYNIRGIAKSYNGDYEGGIKDIDKSLEIDVNNGYARFNKALTYELFGNMDKALEWYNKALEVEDYVWSYYGMASIYGRRGDVANTMTYLNKAIKIDSGVKEVAKTEKDFNPVKNSEEFQKAIYN